MGIDPEDAVEPFLHLFGGELKKGERFGVWMGFCVFGWLAWGVVGGGVCGLREADGLVCVCGLIFRGFCKLACLGV